MLRRGKLLWFSRHELSEDSLADLESHYGCLFEVTMVNKTIKSGAELGPEIRKADVVAVVAPLPLQAEILRIAGSKPVLVCKNHRVVKEDGSVEFHHAGWTQLVSIQVETRMLTSTPAPEGALR